jgi:hypothetical protein
VSTSAGFPFGSHSRALLSAIGFARDMSEQWANGRQTRSGVADREDLQCMLQQFMNKEVMDGKNKYRCTSDKCRGSLQRVRPRRRVVKPERWARV